MRQVSKAEVLDPDYATQLPDGLVACAALYTMAPYDVAKERENRVSRVDRLYKAIAAADTA